MKDRTGRFPQRPHYDPEELDVECENILLSFLRERHGAVQFPVSTDDLTVLIERSVEGLDLYADLSTEDGDVEGVTEFTPGRRPLVKINRELSTCPSKENRLRTTLTHEYGHVCFHTLLFETSNPSLPLWSTGPTSRFNKCKRDTIVGASPTDWMEWQAGYVCGAFLMPIGALRDAVRQFRDARDLLLVQIGADSFDGLGLIDMVATAFQSSRDAARVRLLQKRFLLEPGSATRNLFG